MAKPVCLISGGSSGIGAACVVEFVRHGWNVVASYFGDDDPDAAQSYVDREVGSQAGEVLSVGLDVADEESCRRAAVAAVARWGRLDALVNCAGITKFVPHTDLEGIDAAEFRRLYDVNLIGCFQLTRACAAALRSSGAGAVVNISSIAGLRGSGSSIAYAASKGALNSLTLSLARSLAPSVRVNAIAPGFVDGGLPQRMLSHDQYEEVLGRQAATAPLGRVSQPAEIAALTWFMCACAPGMTGHVAVVDNGLQL
ncbi:SDR family NAD(P)-dependent oxidoreductase [Bradyrhizobium mercantei]|uniref:SDR family NAD(P)-dependent oxidoreductase n=1 Tax=Bradyrhizobium mercantei TaxID=1904807 RepID=UPI0009789C2B|nr:SDR family oxidoreductase [Bradyrhizobium mercantei]